MSHCGDSRSEAASSKGEATTASGSTRAEDMKAITAELERLGVAKPTAVMAAKRDAGTAKLSAVRLQTNVHGIRLSDVTVYRYDVQVTGYRPDGRSFEISKPSRSDYTASERRKLCSAVINAEPVKHMFNDVKWVYDSQKILFTNQKLDLKGEKMVLTVDPAKENIKVKGTAKIEIALAQAMTNFQLNLLDMSHVSSNLSIGNQSLAQFVDIATSQYARDHPESHVVFGRGTSYLMTPWEEEFEQHECPSLPEGKYVAVGAHKGAMYAEGPRGRGGVNIAVSIDTAKTAFHNDMCVLEKAHAIVPSLLTSRVSPKDLLNLRKQLRGIYAQTEISGFEPSTFEITNVSSSGAKEKAFDQDGKMVTVFDYYKEKYGLTLQFPNAPLLECQKAKGTKLYFPMELSHVLDCQRVTIQQQTAAQLKAMKPACIVPPAVRFEQNKRNARALSLWDEKGQWLRDFGLNVVNHGLEVDARVLPPPKILYGGNKVINVDPKKMWTADRVTFAVPASIKRWVMYAIVTERDRFDSNRLRKFANAYVQTASKFGMEVAVPADMDIIRPSTEEVVNRLRIAKTEGCEFAFFIQNDQQTLHEVIKDAERQFEIVTQDFRVSRVAEVVDRGKFMALQNTVFKTNIKLGGLNHEVIPISHGEEFVKSDRLFVGFAFSHTAPLGTGPYSHSVVGFAANWKNPSEFIGDFGYQAARRTDNTLLVRGFVRRILEHYKKGNSGPLRELIIYRGGGTASEYGMIHRFEVPLIRAAVEEAGYRDTRLTLIVVSKLHNVRFVPTGLSMNASTEDQNVRPGTVIDTKVVHPVFNEFYLNSHRALQGTSKAPRYTVLVDDSEFSMDTLEQMTYGLCFEHQIVTLSTSLPTPLYVANRYAERGRRLYTARCAPSDGGSSDAAGDGLGTPFMDVDEANVKLPYRGTVLENARINA